MVRLGMSKVVEVGRHPHTTVIDVTTEVAEGLSDVRNCESVPSAPQFTPCFIAREASNDI
jgi:hypothetical protein